MKTTQLLEALSIDQLCTATGGELCHRESMGYTNPPGTCEQLWSSAPGYGQNGFMGLDSGGHALQGAQLARFNQGRVNLGLKPITDAEAQHNAATVGRGIAAMHRW